MIRSTTLSGLLITASCSLFAAAPSVELPGVYPVCTSPQPIAPVQTAFPTGNSPFLLRPALLWNGKEFGMLWTENGAFPSFASLFADGTLRAFSQPVTGITLTSTSAPDMAWDGTQYGVAVAGRMAGDTFDQIYFFRLSRDGALIGSPLRVSQTAAAPVANAANPQIASFTGRFAIVWNDSRAGGTQDVYMSGANSNGTLGFSDLLLSLGPAAGDQVAPAIAATAVFPGYEFAAVAWQDFRTGTKQEIYTASVGVAAGTIYAGPYLTVSPPAGNATMPALASRGNGLGLAWADTRDGGSPEIYFATLFDSTQKYSADTRLTTDPATSDLPRVAWTGGEYEVVFRDNRTGSSQIFWQRVSDDSAPVGAGQRLSSLSNASVPAIAFDGTTFGVGAFKAGWQSMEFEAFGCAADVTPPSCPGNYMAYGITGNNASISWAPAVDNETGVAYYQVYRNNAALAKTSDTFFNDSGLNTSTTYNYFVQPVNAYQLPAAGCTGSVYLKTNIFLTLTVNKSTPDALLNWTDAGMNSYNIFRGTDPRVMQQIGQTPALTAADANALGDAVSYFYTVDDPGD